MTTFLIYQALAYLGDDAARWLVSLETGGEGARDGARRLGRLLGGIEVQAASPGGASDEGWATIGQTGETGPIAVDARVVPLPSRVRGTTRAGEPLRLRLRLTRGLWRVDHVALVSLGQEALPIRILPANVTRRGADDLRALRALRDREEALVTLPGEELSVHYELPESPVDYEYFLEARGYYLEWMREEWRAEQDGMRAAALVFDPAGSLRRLAPAFKQEEPLMEDLFWNSRYERD